MNLKIVAVIQAHMGSRRLPGKVLKNILDKPMLEHLISRLKLSKEIDEIIVATTPSEKDKEIIKLAKRCGVKWFKGSEEDVLDRIVQAAEEANADIVVRVTSDNPLTDPLAIDKMVKQHIKAKAEYTWINGMLVGTAAEVISIKALKKVHRLARDPYDIEHVTSFIKRNKKKFKIELLSAPPELFRLKYRLTVDYEEDLKLMNEIFKRLYKPNKVFPLYQVIELLDKHPNLLEINTKVKNR